MITGKRALDEALRKLATNLNNWYKTELIVLERGSEQAWDVDEYIYLYQNGGWYADPDRERFSTAAETGCG